MKNCKVIVGIRREYAPFPTVEIVNVDDVIYDSCDGITFENCSSQVTHTGREETCLVVWHNEKTENEKYPMSSVVYIRFEDSVKDDLSKLFG